VTQASHSSNPRLSETRVFLHIRSPAPSAIVIRQVKETIEMFELCFAPSDLLMAETVTVFVGGLIGKGQNVPFTYCQERHTESWKIEIDPSGATFSFGCDHNRLGKASTFS
jgi:hypothetical protein